MKQIMEDGGIKDTKTTPGQTRETLALPLNFELGPSEL